MTSLLSSKTLLSSHLWEAGVDERLRNREAERVAVIGSSFPQLTDAVLFNEDFVTVSTLREIIKNLKSEMSEKALNHCRGMRKIVNQQTPSPLAIFVKMKSAFLVFQWHFTMMSLQMIQSSNIRVHSANLSLVPSYGTL